MYKICQKIKNNIQHEIHVVAAFTIIDLMNMSTIFKFVLKQESDASGITKRGFTGY